MQINSSIEQCRVDTYRRDPDPLPVSSDQATAALVAAWKAAHIAAIEHDIQLGLVKTPPKR